MIRRPHQSSCSRTKQNDGGRNCLRRWFELEADANTELELAHRESRGKGQRRCQRGRGRIDLRSGNIKGGESGCETKPASNNVVHTGVIRTIEQIETFRQELKIGVFTHLEPARDPHIKRGEIRTLPRIARGSNRPVIGGVAITVHISSGEQIERMTTVVANNRGKLET